MKWIRRLLLVLVVGVVFMLLASAAGYKLLHGKPRWYTRLTADPEAANRANQRLIDVASRTARLQNQLLHPESAQINARRTGQTAPPADHLELTLTEEELNGFFQSWDQLEHWSDRYSRYLRDPQLVLSDHHLILAGTAVDLDTVVSAEIEPRLTNGKLELRLVRVMGGDLPLPRSFWDRYRRRILGAIQAPLVSSAAKARIDSDGWANREMVGVVLGRLLADALNDQPSAPLLFLPAVQSNKDRYLPVRLTQISIDQKELHLGFVPLTAAEREELLTQIQLPAPGKARAPVSSD